ncbi:MAG: hypothetical protein KatS3mg015_0499 [Fimbriimonadales bacterium]|nr:MAG: hypothetical protein KatS3mg015_0499 [Fimbriimonadales bacterium]
MLSKATHPRKSGATDGELDAAYEWPLVAEPLVLGIGLPLLAFHAVEAVRGLRVLVFGYGPVEHWLLTYTPHLLFVVMTISAYRVVRMGGRSAFFFCMGLLCVYLINHNFRSFVVWPGTFEAWSLGENGWLVPAATGFAAGTTLALVVNARRGVWFPETQAWGWAVALTTGAWGLAVARFQEILPVDSVFAPTRHIALLTLSTLLLLFVGAAWYSRRIQ